MDQMFDPKKDKLFWPVLIFRRGMSNGIYDLVLYLQSEGLNISWIYRGTNPFQYLKTLFTTQYSTLSLTGSHFIFLKCDGWIWDLGGKFKQKRINLSSAFRSSSFKFFFKRENHGEHPQSKCGWISAWHHSLLYAGVRYLLWRYRNSNLAFIFLVLLKPSLLNLIWN